MKINPAFFYTALAALIWGATVPIMKLTLLSIPVFSLAFIRMASASLILGIIIRDKLRIKSADLRMFFIAAITGVTLNLAFFFWGLKLTQAINAAFLVASVPIFTMLAAHFYLKEKLKLKLVISAIIALIGTVFIIGKPFGLAVKADIIGGSFLLLATLAWVAHEMVAKKLLKSYDGGVVAFYSMAIGAVTFIPFFLWETAVNQKWIFEINITGLAGIIYGIFFSSLIAYWAWQKGLSKLGAGQASFFFYLDPITGTILSILLLGETLTRELIIGGVLIIFGVLLAERRR